MVTLFVWTGMIVWALIALALASLLLFLLNRAVQATVNMVAQVVLARKRGVPRECWTASPAQVWWDAFRRGSWVWALVDVHRAWLPVTPWHPDERKSGFIQHEPRVGGG